MHGSFSPAGGAISGPPWADADATRDEIENKETVINVNDRHFTLSIKFTLFRNQQNKN
tara:strand:- start:98 stop:271 length:174 start_codon:yes stop_codon:yes gene_type:complete